MPVPQLSARARLATAFVAAVALLGGPMVASAAADETTVYFVSPAEGATISGVAADIVVHDSDAEFYGSGSWLIDGRDRSDILSCPSPCYSADPDWSVDTTGLSAGQHVFEYTGVFGGTTTRTFVVRNVVPEVTVTAPAPAAVVSGQDVALSVDARPDPQGKQDIDRVEFFLDGSSLGTDALAPFDFTLDTTRVGNGPHQIRAEATDSVGLVGRSADVTIDVENLQALVTADADRNSVVVGRSARVQATVSGIPGGDAVAGAHVRLWVRRAGQTGRAVVATATTDADGVAVVNVAPRYTSFYSWTFDGDDTHAAATSREVRLVVVPTVKVALPSRGRVNRAVTVTVTTNPPTAGQRLVVQWRVAGRGWRSLGTLRSRPGRTAFTVTFHAKATYEIRVQRAADAAGAAASSNAARIRVS